MARINSKLGVQHLTFDGSDAGEGLAIFLSQNAGDQSRYRFVIKAMLGEGCLQMGVLYSSPPGAISPGGPLTRMIGGAVCPGATSWAVDVNAVPLPPQQQGGPAITPETADVILASSKCCTGPIGASRVNERYSYAAGGGAGSTGLGIFPGQTVKSWTAVASFGVDGTVRLGTLGAVATVPAGFTLTAAPDLQVQLSDGMAFTNVDWLVELAESA